jgi:hypothetical protein
MKSKRHILLLLTVLLFNCQSIKENSIFSKEIIIENISFPIYYSGMFATAVEISTKNIYEEIEIYYKYYLIGDNLSELIIGQKYIFYYKIEDVKFQIYIGEDMKSLENGKIKMLNDYKKL